MSTLDIGSEAEQRAAAVLIGAATTSSSATFAATPASSTSSRATATCSCSSRSAAAPTSEHGHAVEMIGPRKQRQVARVAPHLPRALRRRALTRVRFDVVAITGDDVQVLRRCVAAVADYCVQSGYAALPARPSRLQHALSALRRVARHRRVERDPSRGSRCSPCRCRTSGSRTDRRRRRCRT